MEAEMSLRYLSALPKRQRAHERVRPLKSPPLKNCVFSQSSRPDESALIAQHNVLWQK